MHRKPLLTLAVWLLASTALVAADRKAKILLIGKDLDHARNTHTYLSDCALLAGCLRQTDGVETVISNGWPKDPDMVEGVTAIVLHTRLGGTVLFRGPQRQRHQVEELLKKGVGVTAIHWGTGAETPEGGPWLQTMGAWFNAEGDGFSRYLVQSSKLRQVDRNHPVCRGWDDFDLREEYYFKLCFLPEARPVMSTVIEGKEYPIGWVYERRNGGRSFGFVGGHFHDNFGLREFRQAVVNGILWTAHVDVPEKGAPISITAKDMELPPEEPKKK
jgi:type 1 glutamine amidotransferase